MARIGKRLDNLLFSMPLDVHLANSGRRIALPIEICCKFIRKYGFGKEETFLIEPRIRFKELIRQDIRNDIFYLHHYIKNTSLIGFVLLEYLEKQMGTILSEDPAELFAISYSVSDENLVLHLIDCVKAIPQPNRDNFQYLIKFFSDYIISAYLSPSELDRLIERITEYFFFGVYWTIPTKTLVKIMFTLVTNYNRIFPVSWYRKAFDALRHKIMY